MAPLIISTRVLSGPERYVTGQWKEPARGRLLGFGKSGTTCI